MRKIIPRVQARRMRRKARFLLSRGLPAAREKGHRMALSSGSSVSEDVWSLIKMCRASGQVLFLSSILSPHLPPPPLHPFVFFLGLILRVAISSCMRAIGLRLLKRPGSVTWTAAARSSMCEEPMRPEDVSSFPATDRPTTD